ncbi:hypothetical protein N9K16_00850 [Alphaproteobacteria bacterium]|nr:hypothetical protein [Alphaproteobacteria bacterium]
MNNTNTSRNKAPWHLWAVGLLAILWYLNGLYDFASTTTRQADYTAQFSEAMHRFYDAMPIWAIAAWGAAEVFGIVGGVLLLFKNQFSFHAFGCGLLAILVNFVYNFILADASTAIGSSAVYFEAIVVISTSLFLAYSYWMSATDVLS